jgi:outer membrane lipoprotein LolB
MRRLPAILSCALLLDACATTRPAPPPAAAWEHRVAELQSSGAWRLDGRAAVAVGAQGWQATLSWRQHGDSAQVHLAGPFGAGALEIERTPAGISLNGAPPSDDVLAQLQERLGFELPLDHLRFWLQGAPDPGAPFDLKRNDQDRALQLTQDGWSVDYDRYMPVNGDLLPARLVLSREGARVRVVVDRWEWHP